MKERFFKLAEKLSEKSNHPSHKHGAVIVRKSQILGFGFNEYKSHPKSNHPFKMKHAEFSAVLNTKLEDLSGCDIYIFRKTKNDKIANSKPCHFCELMLKSLNVKRVFYSHEENYKMEQYK